jgi:Mor family transcriptional regulator
MPSKKEIVRQEDKQISREIPEIIRDMADMVAEILESRGLMHNHLKDVQHEFSTRMMSEFAGMQVYLPKGKMVMIRTRNEEILAQYEAGKTINAIANDCNVTASYVYRVISGDSRK